MSLHEELQTTTADPGSVGLWWLGQSSYALKNAACEIIYIDPYLTSVISPLSYIMHTRLIPPVVDPEADVDVLGVLITHDHLDHLDPNSTVMLAANENTTFYGSGEAVHKLVEVLDIPASRVESVTSAPDFEIGHYTVHTVKAVHGGGAVGYVIQVDGLTLYFSGDTVLFYSMRDIGAAYDIDVAFFCINGQAGNMDIQSALHAVVLTNPRTVVPNHYGMYADNTADPEKFAYLFGRRFPDKACLILEPGRLQLLAGAT